METLTLWNDHVPKQLKVTLVTPEIPVGLPERLLVLVKKEVYN